MIQAARAAILAELCLKPENSIGDIVSKDGDTEIGKCVIVGRRHIQIKQNIIDARRIAEGGWDDSLRASTDKAAATHSVLHRMRALRSHQSCPE